jgi:hypothetical protein
MAMIEATTGIGFPVGPPIGYEELRVWGFIALAILVGSALALWLFRARDARPRPGPQASLPRLPLWIARPIAAGRRRRRGGGRS